jgi:hypothetical protein
MAIRIGTSEHDGTFHSQGRALKVILDRQPSLAPVEVLTADTPASNAACTPTRSFGFMAANWIGRAKWRSAVPQSDRDPHGGKDAGPLFFVGADSAVGRSPTCAPQDRARAEKSGMVQHAHTMFGVLGLAFSEFSQVYLVLKRRRRWLQRGRCRLQCPIPNKVTALSEQCDVQVLPYAPGQLETLLGAVSFYRHTVMRKAAFRGLDADVAQPAVVNILATHARVPDDIVRAAVAAIIANADELGRINPLFNGLGDLFAPLKTDGAKALEFGGVALHPGAVQAYREAGLLTA